MTPSERQAMYAATCRCCTLATAMRDCANCVFNVLEPSTPADAARAAIGEGPEEGWLCGTNYVADHKDFLDLRATEEGARF